MSKLMLIDAAHPEQTRVAVIDGNRVEEFDFESQSKKQLRGNIYLAKITRVEASLQAAFVDYGGNRHGFLAFNEIHPDYYQIPVKDREELLRLEEEEEKASEATELAEAAAMAQESHDEISGDDQADAGDSQSSDDDEELEEDTDAAEEAAIAVEAAERRRRRRVRELRRYKIQEVIKPGQVLLVQVSKEERGNKGAALTSYLSLAGRYCVLMPNTARGGGISRKISNAADRKRLKSVTESLDLPKGVGLIIRTAGSKRTKVEIRRDYEYLGRLWGTIRENTLSSMAPSLVHQEGGLVRRAVRDLYDKDIEAIHVEGTEAYHEAHDFMKMLMPSHAPRVKQYKGTFPIFLKHQVEAQLEAIYDTNVRLKSGGYLVIHQTEALVAIDVNSGRSTKERNIEATALKTNLEAAEEACRQMRLRDLAGLLVIDFIDMDENKNIRAVEKRMKDALKRDRARIQMGRISSFGLMELSRQRRRASVIEGSSQVCPTCAGIGVVRSVESAALSALQALEGEVMKGKIAKARLTIPTRVALYLLNEKRDFLAGMEREMDMRLLIDADATMHPPQFEIETLESRKGRARIAQAHKSDADSRQDRTDEHVKSGQNDVSGHKERDTNTTPQEGADANAEETPRKRRRGRRGGRGRRKGSAHVEQANTQQAASAENAETAPESTTQSNTNEDAQVSETKRRPRRRRKPAAEGKTEAPAPAETVVEAAPEAENKPKKRPVRRRRKPAAEAKQEAPAPAETVVEAAPEAENKPKKRPVRRRRKPSAVAKTETPAPDETVDEAAPEADDTPKKRPVRRRRKPAAEEKTESPAPAENLVEAVPEAGDTPKKRPVRRRRKPSAKAKTEAPAPAETVVEAAPEADVTPKKRPVRRRRKPASEKQAVSADAEDSPQEPPAGTSEAGKKSWWARRFSG